MLRKDGGALPLPPSTMNPVGGPAQAAVEKKKSSLWYRRSLRGSLDQHRYRHSTDSLARTPKPRQCLVDYSDPQRLKIVLEKEDNETFGFEVQSHSLQLRTSSVVEVCTFVSKVAEKSPAETAGLSTGDVIVTINGNSIEGFSHQHILDLIKESSKSLQLETVCGSVVKWIELEKRVNQLKVRVSSTLKPVQSSELVTSMLFVQQQSLSEKLKELQELTLREARLIQGMLKEHNPSSNSSEVHNALTGHRSLRSSSDGSCKGLVTDDSDQGSVFGDLSSPSPLSAASVTREEHFFWNRYSNYHQVVGRSSSSSLASSSSSSTGSQSPTWDRARITSLFGTMPRKNKRTSVRKNILKLIPGLHQRSVEEEET
ncbi:cytohesin-interacting protein isoform X1 [Stigmatopora nigra]